MTWHHHQETGRMQLVEKRRTQSTSQRWI
ncbi:hypothetical protein CBI45_04810 [Corynebacterium kefirresidentii]|nr:hypothetical protein CBI45_04810 [Corynebacterium kefirresidentii]